MNQIVISLIASAVLLIGCTATQEAPSVKSKELKSYQIARRQWRSVVIAPNLEKDKLVALAQYLHRSDPTTSFNIFDDDNAGEYTKRMEAESHLWRCFISYTRGMAQEASYCHD